MKIFKEEIDLAGKYRYWVQVKKGELIMVKFESEQPADIVLAQAEKQVAQGISAQQETQDIETTAEGLEVLVNNYLDDYYETQD